MVDIEGRWALQKMAASDSWIVVGSCIGGMKPEREYLEAIGATRSDFEHIIRMEAGREHGLKQSTHS